jgi:enolase
MIKSVRAQEVFTKRTFPGVEAVVLTEGGHEGRAICASGESVGTHEVKFAFDGGQNGLAEALRTLSIMSITS